MPLMFSELAGPRQVLFSQGLRWWLGLESPEGWPGPGAPGGTHMATVGAVIAGGSAGAVDRSTHMWLVHVAWIFLQHGSVSATVPERQEVKLLGQQGPGQKRGSSCSVFH